jgi:hypothetical protein
VFESLSDGGAPSGCEKATPCRSAKWGCCPDLLNPAHGPSKEGCCLNTEFGCCPDNTAAAQGPDNKGCGCEFTEFKCCPDDVTPARGQNFEGTVRVGCLFFYRVIVFFNARNFILLIAK